MQAGQGLWLLTWRPRHMAAPSTDGAFPGSLRLLWRASLHQPTARVPLLLELWGAVSAMLEGEVGGPRSKSCQGFGAKAGVRSSFFGKVGFGGRGADLAGFSPGRADGEAGPAAACALLLGKLKHTWGGVGGGRQAQPRRAHHPARCSLQPLSGGRSSNPSGCQEQPPWSPSNLEAGSRRCRLDPAQGAGWKDSAWAPCSSLGGPSPPVAGSSQEQTPSRAPQLLPDREAPRPQPWPPPSQPVAPALPGRHPSTSL